MKSTLLVPGEGLILFALMTPLGKQFFTALGLDPEGESEEQINEKLLAEYNAPANLKMGLNKELEAKYEYCIMLAQFSEDDQATMKDVVGFIDSPRPVFKIDLMQALLKASPKAYLLFSLRNEQSQKQWALSGTGVASNWLTSYSLENSGPPSINVHFFQMSI